MTSEVRDNPLFKKAFEDLLLYKKEFYLEKKK